MSFYDYTFGLCIPPRVFNIHFPTKCSGTQGILLPLPKNWVSTVYKISVTKLYLQLLCFCKLRVIHTVSSFHRGQKDCSVVSNILSWVSLYTVHKYISLQEEN